MPPKTLKAAAGKRKPTSSRTPKQRSPEELLRLKYRRLHDQLQDGFIKKGLKTCGQILSQSPKDPTATRTKAQLLIALDRFKEAVTVLEEASRSHGGAEESLQLAKAYCLYKAGKEQETLDLLDGKSWEDETERGAMSLRAQTLYRLERYLEARDLYEELLGTADPDHPEYADLEANLKAAQARIDFTDAVPSQVAKASSSRSLPDIETLESTPVAPLIAAHDDFKAKPGATPALPLTQGSRKRKAKEPKPLDPSRPPPDPERWLPKRQRASYVPPRSKLQVKRDKAREKLATQGTGGGVDAVAGSSRRKKRGGK